MLNPTDHVLQVSSRKRNQSDELVSPHSFSSFPSLSHTLSESQPQTEAVVPFSPAVRTYHIESNSSNYLQHSPRHASSRNDNNDENPEVDDAPDHLIFTARREGEPEPIAVSCRVPIADIDEQPPHFLRVPAMPLILTEPAVLPKPFHNLKRANELEPGRNTDTDVSPSNPSKTWSFSHTAPAEIVKPDEYKDFEGETQETYAEDSMDIYSDCTSPASPKQIDHNFLQSHEPEESFKPWYKRWYIMLPLCLYAAALLGIGIAVAILYPRQPDIQANSLSLSNIDINLLKNPITISAKLTLDLEVHNPNRYKAHYSDTLVYYRQSPTASLSAAQIIGPLMALNLTSVDVATTAYPDLAHVFLQAKDLFNNKMALLQQLSMAQQTTMEGTFLIPAGEIAAQSSTFLTVTSELSDIPLVSTIVAMTTDLPIEARTRTHGYVDFLFNSKIDYNILTSCDALFSLQLLTLTLHVKQQSCHTAI